MELTMHMQSEVDEFDIRRLQERIEEIGYTDELTITMEAADAHEAVAIIELLEENGFSHEVKGSHDGNTFSIIARRMLH
ncbi:hypothetical protein V6C27_02685 [Peptococcaceae bacterium 1198_IL3148]